MNNLKNIECIGNKCTACRTCELVCPKKAIKLMENKEGFYYPVIDKKKCINCGLCLSKCHIHDDKIKNEKKYAIYAIKPKDIEISKNSTSAGIAYLIAKKIIDKKGFVYGSVYGENLNVNHIRIGEVNELEHMRGSKYVISDVKDTFNMVKEDLESSNFVLYTGTPCQISGLKKFLGKTYENLITIDIVCHGVPSQKLFLKYIQFLEEKLKAKIIKYDFRNKEKIPWGCGYSAKIETNTGIKKYLRSDFDPYYINFLQGNLCRESCYQCKYADINSRPADLTVADFWGIEKYRPKFYDKNGVSLVIVNSSKGYKIINKLKCLFEYEKVSINEAISYNKNLVEPTYRNEVRDNIYEGIDELKPKEYITKKLKVKINIKTIIKNLLPSNLKILYKKRSK